MVFNFSINFNTRYGQNLFICGSIPELGGGQTSKAIPLEYKGESVWTKSLNISSFKGKSFSYKYIVKEDGANLLFEVGQARVITLGSGTEIITAQDQWQGSTDYSQFLTTPFSEILFPHKGKGTEPTHRYSKELIIRVTSPAVEKTRRLYISGNTPELGEWDALKSLPMNPIGGCRWEIHLPCDKSGQRIEYKFLQREDMDSSSIWENIANRNLYIPELLPNETLIVEHSSSAFTTPSPRFVGTAIPVFSLRSKESCGIGEFADLKKIADWAAATGQSIIQILPINDTTASGTWRDSYPYGGITVMALHPIYINIPAIGPFATPAKERAYIKKRDELNNLPSLDYEAVIKYKTDSLKESYKLHSQETFSQPAYKTFYRQNAEWLIPYCAFCFLRDKFKTADFSKWGEYSSYTPDKVEKLDISFHLFVQYHLHKQLSSTVAYCHKRGIAIKGDIPIGITPCSVDTWKEPQLFNMNSQAGAPPDDFAANGQNWGFPTYNWEAMSRDGYNWWKRRFRKMNSYFDAYRIDHVLGFFRIWEIPASQRSGLMGHFNPSLPFHYEELLSRGFPFNFSRHSKPFIRYYMLKEIFGDETETVMDSFLNTTNHPDTFSLKPQFDTQKKIEEYFEGSDNLIEEGLKRLVTEVLFIEDPIEKGKFHPRICAQKSYSYQALSQQEKDAYDAIYDDFFYHRHNTFWREMALKKLPELISATGMLPCAEDLGMIPECVPQTLRDLRIASLEIQRMPKESHLRFADPRHYPYLSICTTGTHDTSTIREWWEEDKDATQYYFNDILHHEGEAPEHCERWINIEIIKQHLLSGSMFTILPLQEWFAICESLRVPNPATERINIPSAQNHCWKYRMHITLEDLIRNTELNYNILQLTESATPHTTT